MIKHSFKYRIKFYCSLLVLFFSSTIVYATQKNSQSNSCEEKYQILFISSYSYSWESIPHQINGIINALDGDKYIINYEFMDTKNTQYSNGYEEFYNLLKYKLHTRPTYDGVIVGDDAALQFIMQYKDELFPDTPIVFEGIDNIDNAKAASRYPLITGIVEKVDYATNLELANSLFPDANNLVLIHDNMENGMGIVKQLKKSSGLFKDYNVEYLNTSNYTKEEFSLKLQEYDSNSIVFGIAIGEQKGGIIYTEEERHTIIRDYAKVPVFSITQAGVGKGMFGGYIIDHESCGYLAGQMMTSIIEENLFPEIELYTPSAYLFDYNIIKEHNINIKKLPHKATIINKPNSLFQEYSIEIISILSAIILIFIVTSYVRAVSNKNLQVAYNKLVIAEEHIRYQAEHDYLTGLPNRSSTMLYLSRLLLSGLDFTVMIVDLDDFKEINDSCGHVCGDNILKSISRRLQDLIKEDYFYASRFGGDEFLLVVNESKIREDSKIMHEIKEAFSKPIVLNNTKHYLKVSIGIASSADKISKTMDIVSNADLALHAAKRSGKNGHVYYNTLMKDELLKTRKIEQILSTACEEDGFNILYQPQVETNTSMISGYEALLRLKDVFISPAVFIPIAEETDLILKIGRIVTRKVIEQMVQWRENGLELRPVAINFSSKQIRDKGYVSYLKELLSQHDICSSLIEIEFTENIFISNNAIANKLFEDLIELGVNLALDDFGTGYSSIRYLTYVPVKKIKVDKSLVDIFLVDGKDEFILNIIRLSHSLGLKITIEGVEEKHQHERLKEFGCDYIQGYYFYKPVSGEEIIKIGDGSLV